MPEGLLGRVEGLSPEALTPVARRALGDGQLSVLDREISQLDWAAINPITRGLFRISGTARMSSGDIAPWLVVLKVVGDADLIDTGYCHEPADWNYWKREALAFRSGLLAGWPGPLSPVCAYAVDDAADDEVWIWLQACGDVRAKSPADPEKLASTAHDLRAFAAQWAAAPPSRDRYPWLAHRWVGGWVTTFRALGVDHALRHEGCWTTTLLGDVLPRSTHRRVKDLLNAADGLQQRLASLPITLAHHDTQWSNAFPAEQAGRESGTVMIDWSFVGLAPAGTDLGLHVSGNLTSRAVDPQRATDHDRAATDAYLHGLRGHGWAGSTEAVLFARAASAALVAGTWLTGEASWQCPEMIAMVGDEFSTWPESLAEQQRTDVATVMEGWAATFDFLLDLGDEAIRLSDHSL